MFGRRLKSTPAPANLRVAKTPDDTLIWAVGDVHGCADLLQALMTAVLEDIEQRDAGTSHLVFLGDYIDRGPDSRGVLDYLAGLVGAPKLEVHFLRGNHEERMEAFLTQPDLGPGWCEYGGRAALGSFGVAPPTSTDGPEAWETACRQLNAALLDGHRAVLAAQKYSVSIGDYFFAHAGAEPGVPLSAQVPTQLMWIRNRFLDDRRAFEKLVVHGHTPSDHVHADHRRIGIDTGAYATGVLTALRLEEGDRQILQTSRRGSIIELTRTPLQRTE
jgi:serine/threonine protein phosphatase 1